MPAFKYKAKDGPQKLVDGVIEASSLDHAVRKIFELGLAPIDVNLTMVDDSDSQTKKTGKPSRINFSKRIKRSDVVLFTQQMGDLLEASVPLLRSLQIVSRQTQNYQLKKIIEAMTVSVRDGGSLSDALAQYPKIFSSLYTHMAKTGELGGNLDRVLLRLGDYLEKENETISKIKSSLAYPALIIGVGLLTVLVLLTFVIPRISVMFDDLDQTLPLPTVILVGLSGFFARYGWIILVFAVVTGFGVRQWLRTAHGRMQFDRWKLKVPVLGHYVETVEIGRLTRTLATLLEGGITINMALNSVWATIDNFVLRNEIKQVAQKVSNGSSLRSAIGQSSYFPEIVVNMIAMGEETGQLEKGLYKVADTFEKQADQLSKTMVSLLGPIILIVIVMIVGFVVISMLLPIFQMNLIIQ
jgi:general secretion pathway protein F